MDVLMCPQSEVYTKSVATSVLAVRIRVENGCTVRTRRFLLLFRRSLGWTNMCGVDMCGQDC